MPVYLFTLHGYATWMPDRKQGYVYHTRGLEPPSQRMTRAYCAKQNEREACFDSDAQEIIIDAVRSATDHLKATLHGIAVDTTHAHLLVSWQHDRD